jgi:hypothetical protein
MKRSLVLAFLWTMPLAAAAAPATPEAQVTQRLALWLDAQNNGDLKAYDALYALRFTGVKRAGPRTTRFDREGWIQDRTRMFKSPMRVTATGVTTKATAKTVAVTFTQTWASKKFADKGTKQQIWVAEAGTWKIAREEMLESEVDAPSPPAAVGGTAPGAPDAPLAFAWVAAGGVVLDEAPSNTWALAGKATEFNVGVPTVATRAVDVAKLPKELAALAKTKIVAANEFGISCTATITGFALVSRAIPHFGQRIEWAENPKSAAPDEFWEIGTTALIGLTDGCHDSVWARAASLGEIKAILRSAPTPTDEKRVLAAFRALPEYKAIAKDFASDYEGSDAWEDAGTLAVTEYQTKPNALVSVVAAFDDEGCGGFHATLWAIFRIESGGKLTLVNDPSSQVARPAFAAEVDGKPSFFYRGSDTWDFGVEWGRIAPGEKSGTMVRAGELSVPYWDCPC